MKYVPHHIEQNAEHYGRTMPPYIAAVYKGLLREGLTEGVACALTDAWLHATITSMRTTDGQEEANDQED